MQSLFFFMRPEVDYQRLPTPMMMIVEEQSSLRAFPSGGRRLLCSRERYIPQGMVRDKLAGVEKLILDQTPAEFVRGCVQIQAQSKPKSLRVALMYCACIHNSSREIYA